MRYWPKDLNQRCSQSCCCNSPKVILILINATKGAEPYTEKERGDPDTNKALQKQKIFMLQKENTMFNKKI